MNKLKGTIKACLIGLEQYKKDENRKAEKINYDNIKKIVILQPARLSMFTNIIKKSGK